MQTTYTGEGVYSTYDDGTPVSMHLRFIIQRNTTNL